jgi:pimeloyl-ACP methyl ester carboxylesterase
MEHGTGSQKDEAGDAYKIMANFLADKGIASLRFDFPGCGESSVSSLLYDNEEAIRETQIITKYLINLKEIDANRIGLLGWSQGGVDVLLAASDNNIYKSVATWARALNCGVFVSKEKREEANTTGVTTVVFKWRESFSISKKWIKQADNMDILE